MKYKFIKHTNTPSLAILFTGWGFTPEFYEGADISCDFVIVYDYVDEVFDTSFLNGYANIYLFAWSFGVFEANKFFSRNNHYPIVFSMAVNGTNYPIDNDKGIPEIIFKGTYDNLCERSLNKFYLRMCGNSANYKEFIKSRPQKTISQLKEELLSVSKHNEDKFNDNGYNFKWDVAVISKNDNIFPYENQLKGWENDCGRVLKVDGPHLYSDLVNLINSRIIDKNLIKKRFSRILDSYSKEAIPQNLISKELFRKWASVSMMSNKNILEIGCGTGFLTNLYADLLKPSNLVINDLCRVNLNFIDVPYSFIEGDAEEFVSKTDCKFDYILSASAIQWFENIPLLFSNFKRILNKNGFLVLSTFGKQNFKEIETLTHNSLKYFSIKELNDVLSKDYDIYYLKEDILKIDFKAPIEVLNHLRLTGVNSLKSVSQWTKSDLIRFIEKYPKNDNGDYSLTYNPIYIIARLR